jgi:hypothetical protein
MKSTAASRPGTAVCSKKHLLVRPVPDAPVAHAQLKRPQLPRLEPAPGIPLAEPLEHGERLKSPVGISHQSGLNLGGPHAPERIRLFSSPTEEDPDCHIRAVRSLILAAAAAAANILPVMRCSRKRRTCLSVTIRPPRRTA